MDDDTAPGFVGGVLIVCIETTDTVREQRQQALILALSDAVRELSSPIAIMAAATKILQQELGVTIWLPVADAAPAGPNAESPNEIQVPARHVLIVDDEMLVREVVAAGLAEPGFHTVRAGDAVTALAMLDAGDVPDLLLTDHAIPGMDGVTLIQEARRRQPGLQPFS